MEVIKASGVQQLASLQQSWLSPHAPLLHRLLLLSSPSSAFSLAVPLLLSLQASPQGAVGLQLLYALVWGLRGNAFRQWALGEDRPYWWVKEASAYQDQQAPHLTQYPPTCLSSPAAPSSSVVASVCSVILASHVSSFLREVKIGEGCRKWLTRLTWLTGCLHVAVTAVADMFFASHFPHQVLTSIAIGVTAALLALRMDVSRPPSLLRTFLLNALLMAVTSSVMLTRDINEFNDFQRKAFKWCLRREWMQVDATPFLENFLLVGYLLGAAVALHSSYWRRLNRARFTGKMVASLVLLNLLTPQVVGLAADLLPRQVQRPQVWGWYLWQLLGAALTTLLCGAIVPHFVQAASGVAPLKAKKH